MEDVKKIVEKMTLEEKASFVSGYDSWRTDALKELGVPAIMLSDGPHGLRKQRDADVAMNDSITAVCFPTASGTAASFDRELLGTIGDALGYECRAEDVAVLLGPAVNIKRSPLCGRNFEYFSEDPYLAGELAAAYINGVQAQGTGTSIKHFAVNSQEKRRMTVSAVVDERTLREIYFPAFETAVKKAQPWTVMCSYNKINGTYASENKWLLTDVLRGEWGFKGFVMSDWGAVNDRVRGIKAGLDLEMPSSARLNTDKVIAAVQNGTLDESVLDLACERILNIVKKNQDEHKPGAFFDRDAHHALAEKAAEQSMVLLKNNGVLPLQKGQKVAFIGAFAKRPRFQGGGSSHVKSYRVDAALDCVGSYGPVQYAEGFSDKRDLYEPEKAAQAIAAAQAADVAVVFAGLPESMESESFDRRHMDLPACQNRLIREICAVQKNVVVVLHNGSPVTMPWIGDVSAVLESYLGGEAVGRAQIALLYGEANPCAKLAETFPLALSDTPCYRNFPGGTLTVEHREGIYVGYRYYDSCAKNVLFPFGHGLSYTTFDYTSARLNKRKLDGKTPLTVTIGVKNTGSRAGAEIVQVYVSKPESEVFRPEKELKGFAKVCLEPGEEKKVEITLQPRAFAYYNTEIHDWYCESGEYVLSVGASSRDIRKTLKITLENEQTAPVPYDRARMTSYYSAEISNVSDEQFSRLLGFPIPESEPLPGSRLTMENSFIDATSVPGRLVTGLVRLGANLAADDSMGDNDMIATSTLECPIHSAAAFSNGMLDDDGATQLLNILNGDHVLRSVGRLAVNVAGKAVKIAAAEAEKLYKNIKPKK